MYHEMDNIIWFEKDNLRHQTFYDWRPTNLNYIKSFRREQRKETKCFHAFLFLFIDTVFDILYQDLIYRS